MLTPPFLLGFSLLSSEVCDLLTCVFYRSMTINHFRLFGASRFCLTPHLETSKMIFLEVSNLLKRISCQSMDRIYFGSSSFGSFKLLSTRFFHSAFTQRLLSIDTYPSWRSTTSTYFRSSTIPLSP
jgi:hypothetical protein